MLSCAAGRATEVTGRDPDTRLQAGGIAAVERRSLKAAFNYEAQPAIDAVPFVLVLPSES
jgi:hypothetical protein